MLKCQGSYRDLNLGADHVSSDSEEVAWFQHVLSSPYMFSPLLSCIVILLSTLYEGLQRGGFPSVGCHDICTARFVLMLKCSAAEEGLVAATEPDYQGISGVELPCPC